MSVHKHQWHMAKYTDSYLIPVGEGVQHYTPPHAFFVCDCGASKGVDVLASASPSKEANLDKGGSHE